MQTGTVEVENVSMLVIQSKKMKENILYHLIHKVVSRV